VLNAMASERAFSACAFTFILHIYISLKNEVSIVLEDAALRATFQLFISWSEDDH
jgi:hypothetical protein